MKSTLLLSWILVFICTGSYAQTIISGSNSTGWEYRDFTDRRRQSTDAGWANPGNGESVINISDPTGGLITDINVTISGVNTTYVADLLFVLEAPDSTMIGLMLVDGGSDLDNVNLIFDSDALNDFYGVGFSDDTFAPANQSFIFTPTLDSGFSNVGNSHDYDGIMDNAQMDPYRSLGSSEFDLSNLNGKTASGAWTLHAYDIYDVDTASVTGGWSLEITTLAAAVPEPSTYALILGGIASIFVIVRRRKSRAS